MTSLSSGPRTRSKPELRAADFEPWRHRLSEPLQRSRLVFSSMRVAIIALLAVWTLVSPVSAEASNVGPRSGALIDQRGQRFALKTLRPHPVVMTFVASRCKDACPVINARFFLLQNVLLAHHSDARLVTITLDPDYDTPFVMSRLAQQFGANPGVWRFVSGDPTVVRRLMASFGVQTVKGPDGVPDVHSTYVYFVNATGRLARVMLFSTNFNEEALKMLESKGFARHDRGNG